MKCDLEVGGDEAGAVDCCELACSLGSSPSSVGLL